MSPSSSSTSASAVATSAYVRTPVAWPLTTRSFTSSSSCRSATDILFLGARRAQREGAGPSQTVVVNSNATDSEVKRPEAEFPLPGQSTKWSLPTVSTVVAGSVYPERLGLESPAMADDGGVLGNLPNSRPGKRSTKRDSGAGRPAKAAAAAAAKAEADGKPAAKPARTSRSARTNAKPGKAAAGAGAKPKTKARAGAKAQAGAARRPPAEPITPGAPPDPVTAAVRTAAGLAVMGVRVAGVVTQELLRRLPRP